MVHKILSLDLGSNTGWCYLEDGKIINSGVATFKKHKDEKPGKKFFEFQNFLIDFNGVDEIYYEIVPRTMSRYAAEVYHGFLAILHVFNYSMDIRCSGIYSGTWKKEFTGKGNAKKHEVCKQAIDIGWLNGKAGTDQKNDEADSIGVAFAIQQKRGITVTF